jgi:hypothetical protein
MKRGREAQRPALANAKLAFTPIVQKQPAEVGTPFHPLQVADLETPKPKPAKAPLPAPVPEPQEPEEPACDGFQDLRQALLVCVDIVARLERASESKVFRSVGTQTQSAASEAKPRKEAAKAVKPLEATEVLFSDDSHSSPVAKPKPRDADARPKARPALAPAGNARPPDKPEQADRVTPHANPNLQKQMHEMSLVLRRLETQLDGINAPT